MASRGAATAMKTIANNINEAIAIGPLVTARNSALPGAGTRCSGGVGSKPCVIALFFPVASVSYSWIQDRVQEINEEIDNDVYK